MTNPFKSKLPTWLAHRMAPSFVVLLYLINFFFLKLYAETTDSPTSSTHCVFVPPNEWEIADPKSLSQSVKIAFIKRSNKGFCPSINLAIEETDASLNEYLKAVKSIHEQDRENQWRTLGKVQTPAGLAQLTEINTKVESGPIRILQLILVKDSHAYILTAAALKEEFSQYYKEFQTAFRTLTLTHDLLSNVPQIDRREMLKEKQSNLLSKLQERIQELEDSTLCIDDPYIQTNLWLPFQNSVLENFQDMGAYWQVLVLKDAQKKMALSIESQVTSFLKQELQIDDSLSDPIAKDISIERVEE